MRECTYQFWVNRRGDYIKKDRSFRKTPVLVRQLFINYLEQTYNLLLSYQNQDIRRKILYTIIITVKSAFYKHFLGDWHNFLVKNRD